MRISSSGFFLLCLLAEPIFASWVPTKKTGLIGIQGFNIYDPVCAHACFRLFSNGFTLECTTTASGGGHEGHSASTSTTSPECRASNFPYLSSLSWCIHTKCPPETPASKIELFWQTQITGDVKVVPKWSYGEVLANITEMPTQVQNGTVLTITSLTPERWGFIRNALWYFYRETCLESVYGYVVLIVSSDNRWKM